MLRRKTASSSIVFIPVYNIKIIIIDEYFLVKLFSFKMNKAMSPKNDEFCFEVLEKSTGFVKLLIQQKFIRLISFDFFYLF